MPGQLVTSSSTCSARYSRSSRFVDDTGVLELTSKPFTSNPGSIYIRTSVSHYGGSGAAPTMEAGQNPHDPLTLPINSPFQAFGLNYGVLLLFFLPRKYLQYRNLPLLTNAGGLKKPPRKKAGMDIPANFVVKRVRPTRIRRAGGFEPWCFGSWCWKRRHSRNGG